MSRWFVAAVLACTVAACGGGNGPTGPTSNPRLSRTKMMAFGDSLTSGEVTAPVSRVPGSITALIVVPAASYPTNLQAQLQTSYPSQASAITVTNQGRSGETVFDGVIRFEQVFDESRPDVVLIQEGVNGISSFGATASTALIRAMVQRAQNGQARVFVGSMVPTIAGRQRSQDANALVAYNSALQAMTVQEGVVYVDLYNGMLPQVTTWIGIDGLHPNEAGYRRMAELFAEAIRANLEVR